MIQSWVVLLVAIIYLSILFVVASHGDRTTATRGSRSRPNIYAFSLAIYCTTWTFFGSVGLAATSGINFLAIYVGPIIAITLGFPLFKRVIELSKEERITSVADFLGARYGKNLKVAGVAATIAVIGTIPYIALQLKAISVSINTLIFKFNNDFPDHMPVFGDLTVLIALILALFAILFGTRHADATEHQRGLMLAIAVESVVKLLAFLCVGAFVTFYMFDGLQNLFEQAGNNPEVRLIVERGFDPGNFAILTFLSLSVFLLLPRQFHVAVVENNSIDELKRARWLFPLYLVLINLFVIPIAVAGVIRFGNSVNADDFVLLLPLSQSNGLVGLFAFIGGLSAGTAMVVVACVALAIMISNDIVLPLFLRSRASAGHAEPEDMENRILNIRRTAILVVLALAYIYYKAADNTAALASIGLISFAAIAQLSPAFFGGLFWKRATARGAMLGMSVGFCVWAYTLLLPTLLSADSKFVMEGLFGWVVLRPQALFEANLTPLANGVIWSLTFNTFAFVFGSLTKVPDPLERLQASTFVSYQLPVTRPANVGKSAVTVAQLQETIGRYLGAVRTERSLEAYWAKTGNRPTRDSAVNNDLLRFSEQLLASAIGASSSRLVHTLLLKRFDQSAKSSIKLLDQASKALQFNRDVLQTALDQLDQGITVFDGDFRLASWNRQFRTLLKLPASVGQAGLALPEVTREIINANDLEASDLLGEKLAHRLVNQAETWQFELPASEEILEIRTSPMPDGGMVVTWNNITQRVHAAEALRDANTKLEQRVEERTRELEDAKRAADQANMSKTRFLTAASHDLLQPLNAARLYSATLQERVKKPQNHQLAENIGRSLGSVEEILGSILTISRLDTENPQVTRSNFPIRAITEQLQMEFDPIAREHKLELIFVHSSQWVDSDRALLRRALQNLISNALKFSTKGKVLIGCRPRGNKLVIEVIDTGIGMNAEQQKLAFAEFSRLHDDENSTPGLGLGLSIVERISILLDHRLCLNSTPGKGSRFQITLPLARPVEKPAQATPEISFFKPHQLNGTSVLCIDNDLSILEGMLALLRQWGCKVKTAVNLEEARNILTEMNELPDLILADYHLENATGIELIEVLRHEYSAGLPAVLITADYSEEVKNQAGAAGLLIINKPVKPATLRAIITQNKLQQSAAE